MVVRSNSVWKPDDPGGEKHRTGFVAPTRLQVLYSPIRQPDLEARSRAGCDAFETLQGIYPATEGGKAGHVQGAPPSPAIPRNVPILK